MHLTVQLVTGDSHEFVSMPSTSGDASDVKDGWVNLTLVLFQCPQHRAMHLTSADDTVRTSVDKVSMPSTSGDASDKNPIHVGLLQQVSMPSTSGDASDPTTRQS